jgi:hypothetical protein
LSIIIYGWGSQLAVDFLNILSRPRPPRLLQKGDALWLIRIARESGTASPPNKDEKIIATAPLALEGAVMLDLTQKKDLRIYENLTADLVFFPGLSPDEAERARKFASRARAVIIDPRGEHGPAIKQVGNVIQLPIINGFNEATSLPSGLNVTEAQSIESIGTYGKFDAQTIGKTLKDIAERLENEPNCRVEFRSSILKVLDAYSDHPAIKAELVRQADVYRWPIWAVQCLPQLYVPLGTLENGRIRILVWKYLCESVPESYPYEITEQLCQGQFFEVEVPAQTTKILKVMAPSFEKNLQGLSQADTGDRLVLVAVHEAMLEIERWLELYEREDAQSFKRKRREVQTKILQVRR